MMNNAINENNNNDTTKNEESTVTTLFLSIFYVFLLIFVILPLILMILSDLPIAMITLGWLSYMVKVCSQIQPDYELILQAIVCLVFVSIGMHTFCYWIYQHKKKNVAKIWKKSWSFAFISLIMVLFVVGMVATGFAAQMNWLSKEKMYRSFHVHHEKVKHLQGYTLTDILLNLRRNKLSLFSRSRDVDVYDYLCVISPEHNLQAIIRFTLPNVQLEPQELFTYVVLKKEDQLEEFQYRKLSVGEIVQSLEKGIIPKE